MTQLKPTKHPKILIINPNCTKSMTDALVPLVEEVAARRNLKAKHHYFTAPSGVESINNEDDAYESMAHCIPSLTPDVLESYDGFLVACYSRHPLVGWLREQVKGMGSAVMGIFEASVDMSVSVTGEEEKFGIVSTGKVWEELLPPGVDEILERKGMTGGERFAGVETTGLNASELHEAPAEEVERKMKEATTRLLKKGGVGAICLGCAGMAGMNDMVRDAAVELLGNEKGNAVRIIDGVQAGVELLDEILTVN